MMLVAAFMVAPTASADGRTATLDVELPLSLDDARLGDAPTLPDAPVEAPRTGEIVSMATGLLECQIAVEVPIAVFGGNTIDSRPGSLDVIVTAETILETITQQVPVMGKVTEVVWQPTGLLAALPAVTREVTAIVGYEDVVVPAEVADLDYNVVLDWREDLIDWTQHDFAVRLNLPAGMPFVRDGLGDIVTDCSGEDLLQDMPDFSGFGDYQYIKVVVGGSQRGDHQLWYLRILDVDVSLAGPEDAGKDVYSSCGLLIAPTDMLNAAQRSLSALQDAIARGDVEVPGSAVSGAEPQEPVAPQAAAGHAVPMTSLVAIAAAAAVACVGAALGVRRFL